MIISSLHVVPSIAGFGIFFFEIFIFEPTLDHFSAATLKKWRCLKERMTWNTSKPHSCFPRACWLREEQSSLMCRLSAYEAIALCPSLFLRSSLTPLSQCLRFRRTRRRFLPRLYDPVKKYCPCRCSRANLYPVFPVWTGLCGCEEAKEGKLLMLDTRNPIVSIHSPHSLASIFPIHMSLSYVNIVLIGSQTAGQLSPCSHVCVETVAHATIAAQFIALIRFSFIACVSAAHWRCEHDCARGEGREAGGGWMGRSLLWPGFLFFIHSGYAVEYRVASKWCL